MSEMSEEGAVQELRVVLSRLKDAKARWCADEVDDAEEMWADVPEMLEAIVPKMEAALAVISKAAVTS